MKTIITILISLFVLNVSGQFQQDSVYFFNPDSTKNWWYVQKDVFSFRCNSGDAYTQPYNTGVINSITYFPYSTRKQSEVRFNPNTPINQRENEMAAIQSADSVEFVSIAITQNKATQNDYSQEDYKRLDDVILVNFTDPNITEAEVDDFMSRNYLTLVHAPSTALPTATWTYLFKISPEYTNTFEASRSIFNSEHGFITRCIPNIVELFEPSNCQPVSEFDDFENTNAKDALWHIRNRGYALGSYGSGKNNADANICECWGEGYHGEGIKVVDIDFGGFDYTHPDMQGQFLTGYNLINTPVTSHITSFWNAAGPIGHGMAVSGVIAAKANGGGQYSAVGVAYNSKIIPMLTSGSTAQISLGIQKAVEVGADIVNMSLGYIDDYSSQSVLYPDIVNARSTGRGGLGIIFTASTGNNDADSKNWPAADTITIGVGATDPNDYRGSFSQSYNAWSWNGNSTVKGSNYLTPKSIDGNHARYHVVAPGTLVYTSFTEDPLGTPNQRSGAWTGTSFSSPLTAGIAAILLSKIQDLL